MSKRFVCSATFLSLTVLGLVAFMASPASAVKEFKDAFKAKYVKPDSTAANDVALASAFDQAGCATCHVGENRKNRNAYGRQLGKLISKKDKKNTAKIQDAMDTVAKLKTKPSDAASPTFGDNIASGKLPAQD